MNRKTGVRVAIVAVLVLMLSGCLKQELDTFIPKLDDLASRFTKTEATASATPRENLSPVISEMQDIKKELASLEHPACCDSMVATLNSAMDNYIKAHQTFLDMELFLGDLDDIVTHFKNTEQTASVTPRISLSPMIMAMQDIKADLSDLKHPACCNSMVNTVNSSMDFYIKAYQAFLGFENDYIVLAYYNVAESGMKLYDTNYAAFNADPQQECRNQQGGTDESTPYSMAESDMATFNSDIETFKTNPLQACREQK